ncbi:MAG TPA: hypothetical protein VMF63_13050 [Opitutaceae bacterium]|nr:hypothetical protein [Opitutaceae bacterium]
MNRREFLRLSAVGAGAALAAEPLLRAQPAAPAAAKPTLIGMPISIAPLAHGDLDALFADMRERAGVTALFPFAYTHEPHRSGVPPSPGYHGGNYGTPHLQYYHDTPLTYADMRAPEFGDVDVLAQVIPVAKRHGIAVYPFLLEDNVRPATVPHWETLYTVDHHGRRSDRQPGGPCHNNPAYLAFTLGLVEDYVRSYEIGGLMWGSERQSGLLNTLSLSQSGGVDPGRTTCFCDFCRQKGRDRGIDVERARQGFGAIEKLVRASRAGESPRDGFFTATWRLLLAYPEALAWGDLWVRSRHEFQAAVYRHVKAINPGLPVGWHVWHNLSFSPFQRAEEDYAGMAGWADFLRPALYNNVAGERFASFVRGARSTVFGDLPPEAELQVLYRQLGYEGEAPLDRLAATGLSADYVARETRRAVDGVAGGATRIWPGIDIDVPAPAGTSRCTPASVGAAVKAVFRGGAHGIILSRNYTEMKPEDLSGAGAALRELGLIPAPPAA